MTATTTMLETGPRSACAGVGYSENPNSRAAGGEAAHSALQHAGVGECDLALLFATSKHDPHALLDGVRAVIGPDARVFGGAATGVMTNEQLGYEGYQCGVAVLRAPGLHMDTCSIEGVDRDEYAAGLGLGARIRSLAPAPGSSLLFVYDQVKRSTTEGSIFSLATALLRGMAEAVQSWPATAGLGMIGDYQFNPTFQFLNDTVLQQAALALLLGPELRMDTITVHGCRPSSGYHTVTRADGNTILEIDGRRAVEVVQVLTGGEQGADWENWPIFLTLGVNRGEKFGDYREDDYAIRLCMAVDKARGGLVMFGDDLQPGVDVQIMRRSITFDYIPQRVDALFARLEGRRPVLALYIDCAGRARGVCGTEGEDAEVMQAAVAGRAPLLGMYSGAEIVKIGEQVQANNWTGVLCLFSEAA
jgi:hypothetical protein